MQVTGSHLRENQEEHPILSETEGEFENSLFDSLSDFDYSNESNEERSFFQKSANLSDELSNHNLTTEEIVEACVLLWRSKRLIQKKLCDKLNISDRNLRNWDNKYNKALRNKYIITTLEELKNRELLPGKLSCLAEVKVACVRLLKNKEMTKKQICEYYRLVPKTLNNWIKNYELLDLFLLS
ncbi:hypothetical protein PFZ81_001175 [Enterococcus hirae]|nr:hypothetical protein [Enterococcus hirae]EMF0233099.1 hypothetical protein [Enterococcus hirae]